MEVISYIIGGVIILFFAMVFGAVLRKLNSGYEYNKNDKSTTSGRQVVATLVLGLIAVYILYNISDGCEYKDPDHMIIRRD